MALVRNLLSFPFNSFTFPPALWFQNRERYNRNNCILFNVIWIVQFWIFFITDSSFSHDSRIIVVRKWKNKFNLDTEFYDSTGKYSGVFCCVVVV